MNVGDRVVLQHGASTRDTQPGQVGTIKAWAVGCWWVEFDLPTLYSAGEQHGCRWHMDLIHSSHLAPAPEGARNLIELPPRHD